MGIRVQAWTAFETAREAQAVEARTHLGVVLAPAVVDGFTVVHVDVSSTSLRLFVFQDGDVFLAVRQRSGQAWEVRLTAGSGGGWEEGRLVESLVHLGSLLGPPDVDPGPAPTVTLWVENNSYAKDAEVLWDGLVWRSLVANNTWGPPGSAGLETVWTVV